MEVETFEAAEQGDGDAVGLEEVPGLGHDLFLGDAFDAVEDLGDGEEALEVHLLAGEVGHAGHGAFEREEQIALELILGAAELAGLERLGFEAAKLLHDEVDDLKGAIRGGAGVDAEGAGVAVGVEVAVDGVDEAAFFADGLEEAGAHAAAEQGIEQQGGVTVGVADGRRGDAKAELDLFKSLLAAHLNPRGDYGRSLIGVERAGAERGEVAGDQVDKFVVLQIAGGGKDHVAGVEALFEEADEGVLLEAADGFAGAEDGLAEGMVLPEALGEDFVDEAVGIVLVHFDFLKDDAALADDFLGGEDGVEDEIGEDVECGGDVLVEDFHVEADGFLAGEGVEIASDGVDFAGDALSGARAGALEDHVFDEVGDSVELGDFVTGAGAHPYTHGDGANMLHAFGEDDETVRKDSTANIAFVVHTLVREM